VVNDKKTIQAGALRDYCCKLFEAVGIPKAEAYINADNLVDADLKGVESHGVSRMAIYLKRLRMGIVRAESKLDIISERPGTALYDACNSMGAAASHKAMTNVIAKARNTGIAFATVRNSNHYSTAAYYAQMALEHNMIGFTASNGPARMAPWGGTDPAFGTSPMPSQRGNSCRLLPTWPVASWLEEKSFLPLKKARRFLSVGLVTRQGKIPRMPKMRWQERCCPLAGRKDRPSLQLSSR